MYLQQYRNVRELASLSQYKLAVSAYYNALGANHYGDLTKELLYLKRLAYIEIEGRDLLGFLPPASRSDIINQNLDSYVIHIKSTLNKLKKANRRTPLDVLIDCVPTMEHLIETRQSKYMYGLNLFDGNYEVENFVVKANQFTETWDKCQTGTIFEKFPDPIIFCRALEWEYPKKYFGFWTKYSPEDINSNVYAKSLHINWIDVYLHKKWKLGSPKRIPDFTYSMELEDIKIYKMPTSVVTSNEPGEIRYTGRQHNIADQKYYEIDVLWRGDSQSAITVSNPFLEIAMGVLREAENSLREELGLPKIGEGWVTETNLYRIALKFYPDAKQHSTPTWLKPQHLDIFIPSVNIAIEYHGRQHFEPVDFFGGQEGFSNTERRDKRKLDLCKKNRVKLIVWKYDETVDEQSFLERMKKILTSARND